MIPIQTQLIEMRKWPQLILAVIFFFIVVIIFDKPEHSAIKIYFISGGLILFTLITYILGKTKIILDNEGITVTHFFNKPGAIKWTEISSSEISWQIEGGHTLNINWEINSINGKQINLQPSYYSRKDLRLIAESLIEKSTGAIIDKRTRKFAEGKFPCYLF